jgi:hypothetical protein
MGASTTPTTRTCRSPHALLNEVNDMFAQLEQMDGAADDKVQLLAEQVVTDLCRPCSTAGPYAR